MRQQLLEKSKEVLNWKTLFKWDCQNASPGQWWHLIQFQTRRPMFSFDFFTAQEKKALNSRFFRLRTKSFQNCRSKLNVPWFHLFSATRLVLNTMKEISDSQSQSNCNAARRCRSQIPKDEHGLPLLFSSSTCAVTRTQTSSSCASRTSLIERRICKQWWRYWFG